MINKMRKFLLTFMLFPLFFGCGSDPISGVNSFKDNLSMSLSQLDEELYNLDSEIAALGKAAELANNQDILTRIKLTLGDVRSSRDSIVQRFNSIKDKQEDITEEDIKTINELIREVEALKNSNDLQSILSDVEQVLNNVDQDTWKRFRSLKGEYLVYRHSALKTKVIGEDEERSKIQSEIDEFIESNSISIESLEKFQSNFEKLKGYINKKEAEQEQEQVGRRSFISSSEEVIGNNLDGVDESLRKAKTGLKEFKSRRTSSSEEGMLEPNEGGSSNSDSEREENILG